MFTGIFATAIKKKGRLNSYTKQTGVNFKPASSGFHSAVFRLRLITRSPPNVQRQHYLRWGGSAQPVKRHCGIAVSLRPGPPSPGSWSSDLGRAGGDTLWFSFAGFILPAPNLLVLYLLIVTEGLQLVRTVPPHSQGFAFLRFAWRVLEQKKRERLAFVVCLTVENEAWRAGAGGSASPLLLLWAGLDYRAWDLCWQHRQTKRDCERRQGKESFSELEKPVRVLEFSFFSNKRYFGSCVCVCH